MKKIVLIVLVALFALSRWYIFKNPPPYYSDVKADYERYANMWRYGTPPYLKHLYEYPPATIPMLSIPLDLDQAGYGKYYSNYRTEILIIDVLFFAYLLFITTKIPWLKNRRFESLLAYILLTTLAKDFFYEGIDLAFTASATMSFTLLYLMPSGDKKHSVVKGWFVGILIWTFFWLSVGIKFLTFPLVVPLFLLLHRGKLVQQIATFIVGFLLIWGIPIAIYRSSLQVMFVHNNDRPIKYASFPAHIIRWINTFTQSEEQHMVAPDFEYVGPVSTQVTNVDKLVFPIALFVAIGSMMILILHKAGALQKIDIKSIQQYVFKPKELEAKTKLELMLWFYLIYIFVLFITAKIFSQPFHIWYIAPMVLVPFQKKRIWYVTIALCALMIVLDMTTWLHLKTDFFIFGSVKMGLIRDAFRFIPMFVILFLSIKELRTPQFTVTIKSKSKGK